MWGKGDFAVIIKKRSVCRDINEIQTAPLAIPPLPDQIPTSGTPGDAPAAGNPGVYAKPLDELRRPLQNDGQELLRHRFLCRGGGLLLVGPTGIGKSSLSMQMMISWALGRALFGIEPARPITSLLIQAENDEGDLAEMRDGVFSGLNVTIEDRALAAQKIFVVQENTRTAEEFFKETVRPMLEQHAFDILWIDPALAYLGGENNSQQAVGAFLRNQLNPLLTEFHCAAVVVHHTNKPYTGPEKRKQVDFAYLGGGSAEWANWSRAILTMQKTTAPNVFELRAPKRGNRLGWKEVDGSTVAYNRFIAHCKDPGTICWIDVDPDLVEGLGDKSDVAEIDVMKYVPLDRPIAKNTLIYNCSRNGQGKNATRDAIVALIRDETLHEWRKPRPGTQPEKYLARIPQPLHPNGKEMFTEMFTAVFAREHLCESDIERCSHLHGPLGPVNICREHLTHHEDQGGVSLLFDSGSNAHEIPPPPASPTDPSTQQPETNP